MAELFENMEKLDIQAERRNTEEQKKRADAAEQNLETTKQNLEAEIQKAEKAIALLIESYQEAGMTLEASCKKLMEKVGLDENEASIQINRYWK